MYDLGLDPKKYFEYMKKPMEEKRNAVDQKWKAVDQTSFEDFYNVLENSGDENQELKYTPVLIPPDSP